MESSEAFFKMLDVFQLAGTPDGCLTIFKWNERRIWFSVDAGKPSEAADGRDTQRLAQKSIWLTNSLRPSGLEVGVHNRLLILEEMWRTARTCCLGSG